MDYVPAAMLWLLTLIRIATAADKGPASVLRATIFAESWQFHAATIFADFTDQARRRHHLMRGRLTSSVASTCVVGGIFMGRVQVTSSGTVAALDGAATMWLRAGFENADDAMKIANLSRLLQSRTGSAHHLLFRSRSH